MAGITAAKDLQESWYQVTILESSPRIGWRLFTSSLSSGVQVDLWASRIHGIENNPIKELIDWYNITTTITDYDNAIVYLSGKQLSTTTVDRGQEIYDTFRDYLDKQLDNDEDSSLDIYIYDYAQRLKPQERILFLSTIQTEITNDIAADPKQVSTINFLKESEENWDDAFCMAICNLLNRWQNDSLYKQEIVSQQ